MAKQRPRHPDKHIEAAVKYAESQGWVYVRSGSHAWGVMHCPGGRGGCQLSVLSTPRVTQRYAEKIRRQVDLCTHGRG